VNNDKVVKLTTKAYIKITMTRSLIGLNRKLYRVAHGLGLTKRGRSVFQPVTSGVAGSVLRLKEIVKIEHATKEQMKAYEKANKPRHTRIPASPGYKVIGNILEMQKEKLSC
jgi:ribosomal protein L30/L7E